MNIDLEVLKVLYDDVKEVYPDIQENEINNYIIKFLKEPTTIKNFSCFVSYEEVKKRNNK